MKNKISQFSLLLVSIIFFITAGQAQSVKVKKFTEAPFKAGDGLFISTFPDTTSFLNGVFPIDDGGFCEFPIIGKIDVVALQKENLLKFLRKNFRSYLRYPNNIYVKPVIRVSLLGGFARPGLYYVDAHSTLWQTVNLAGGPLLEDGIYDMRWERDEDEVSDKVLKYFENGVSLAKMGFKSGDILWTPSPDRRTVWDAIRDVLPVLTFATSMWMLYNTYQRDYILLQRR